MTETNKYNITIWQGSTFGLTILTKNSDRSVMNLTNYSARMQIRSDYASNTILESLTSSNGEITITGVDGKLELELAASRTANLKVDLYSTSKPPKSVYVYDLELQDNVGVVTKLLYGDAIVLGEVTR